MNIGLLQKLRFMIEVRRTAKLNSHGTFRYVVYSFILIIDYFDVNRKYT